MGATLSFVIALSSAVAAAGVLWTARHIATSIDAFLVRVEEADERSRDNYRVLADHSLIDSASLRHIEETQSTGWERSEDTPE